ncbi:hypothetical protein AAX26_00013 [Aliarcobacter thereius]|uniref:Conjugal transfer protein TraF n=2 Tax=Aliarcobacter thereius TaxID=544718 RepID=A0A1C0BAC5_9BACT|nr:conjugal transfer protein TraF [Aliarcobacter thereius]OCL88333.1 hypothetical protein AAX26_00013 [Aliarcobacter thereius]OCL91823.1 hypothetical protein AAX25_00548 [Aliarcobacter thereius]OCL95079.1 hypothetical protein AA347_00525 [Aliarcobacter thereius LMG 24486]OCM00531.1 hypothetical protein AAX29_00535 [Aliarcobacter thereius]QBF16929.1 hypothetical protein ATH_1917 [Aliarcobacter thereius LMG 24486]
MRKITKSTIAVSLILSGLEASQFHVLGSKAASMGGAGIATSPSSLAVYNNPALLAKNKKTFAFHTGVGVGLTDNDVFASVDKLDDLSFSDLIDKYKDVSTTPTNVDINDINTLFEARDIILNMDEASMQANPTTDLSFAIKNFGFGIFGTADMSATAEIDQDYNRLIFKDNSGGFYEILQNGTAQIVTQNDYESSSLICAMDDDSSCNAKTGVELETLGIVEVPLAYGHEFNGDFGDVYLGGAVKFMKGYAYSSFYRLDSDKDIFDDFDDSKKESSNIGIDLGLAYNPAFDKDLTLALVGKNLNKPKFDLVNGNHSLDPMLRVGAAYELGFMELAFDADLTESKSLNGYKTKFVGGGVGFDLWIFQINAGLMKNLANSDNAGLVYTAGIGIGPLEISGQMASKTTEIDGDKYPKYANINASLSFSW